METLQCRNCHYYKNRNLFYEELHDNAIYCIECRRHWNENKCKCLEGINRKTQCKFTSFHRIMCSRSRLKDLNLNFATIEISSDFLIEAKNFKTDDQRISLRQIFLEKKPNISVVLVPLEKI